jgi:hypothetical protein
MSLLSRPKRSSVGAPGRSSARPPFPIWIRLLLASVVLCLVAGSAAAEAEEAPVEGDPWKWAASSGIDYSRGDYGLPDDTEMLYVPFGLRVKNDRFRFKITIPFLHISGADGVVCSGALTCVGGDGATESGLGDVYMSAGYTYEPANPDLPIFEFSFKVKLPTANENKGLGTGEADYKLQVEVAQTFDFFTPFLSAGYRFVGEPSGFDLNDTASTSLGADFRINDFLNIGGSYDWRESASPSAGDIHEAFGYVSLLAYERFVVTPYWVAGMSQNSPDYGLGLQLTVRIAGY